MYLPTLVLLAIFLLALGDVLVGSNAQAEHATSAVVGGDSNKILRQHKFAAIVSGVRNTVDAQAGVIIGGSDHVVTAHDGIVVGGEQNTVSGPRAFAGGGGYKQEAAALHSAVFSGQHGVANETFAIAIGSFARTDHAGAVVLTAKNSPDNKKLKDANEIKPSFYCNSKGDNSVHICSGDEAGVFINDRNVVDELEALNLKANKSAVELAAEKERVANLTEEVMNLRVELRVELNGKAEQSGLDDLDQRVATLERIHNITQPPTESPTRRIVCGLVGEDLVAGRKCRPFEPCDADEDCNNGSCTDGVCDPGAARAVMITFAVLLSLTFVVFLCCCSYCCIREGELRKECRERYEKRVREEEFRMFKKLAPSNRVDRRKLACLNTVLECMRKSGKHVNENVQCDRGVRLNGPIRDMCRRFRILVCVSMQALYLKDGAANEQEAQSLAEFYMEVRNGLQDLSRLVDENLAEFWNGIDARLQSITGLRDQGFQELARILSASCHFDTRTKRVCWGTATEQDLRQVVLGSDEPMETQEKRSIEDIVGDSTDEWNFLDVGRTTDYKRLEFVAMSLMPKFVSGNNESRGERSWFARHFPRFARYPWFYGILLILVLAIFLAFFAKINTSSNGEFADGSSAKRDEFVGRPGGMGKPFFGVPPQYDFAISGPQRVAIPIVYGIMHNVLFMLGLMPLPFCRGLIRDLSHTFPSVRRLIPLNDLEYVHRMCGFAALSGIFVAATIWLSVMGVDCFARQLPFACEAFDPVVQVFANPIENVVMLRLIIWVLWFTFMPLLYFAKVMQPPSFVLRLPLLGMYWYEFCFCTHVLIAYVTLLLAFIGRFFIFYPVLISWGLYAADLIRERCIHCHGAKIDLRHSTYINDNTARPVVVKLQIQPTRTVLSRFLKVNAGQWIYVKFPGIHTFHPFSVTSKSTTGTEPITLLVGVQTNQRRFNFPGLRTATLPKGQRIWTYEVMDKVRLRTDDQSVVLFGPYGDAFQSCFDVKYTAAIVIGAGTGLASVMSVLRDTIRKRVEKTSVPSRLHLVWCCRSLDNLIWCWSDILELLYSACSEQAMDPLLLHPKGAAFDWLNISFFVSRIPRAGGCEKRC